MQIPAIRMWLEALECIFEPYEEDSNHSNANSKQGFESFECEFEPFQRDSNRSKPNLNHSNEIRSIRMQIPNIRKGFECNIRSIPKGF